MKKIMFLVLAMAFVAAVSFAQPTKSATPKGTTQGTAAVQTHTAIGKVSSVKAGNPSQGIIPEISITTEKGSAETFVIGSTTVIHGEGMNVVPLDKLTAGEKVQVKYHLTKAGTKEAKSIKILK